MRSALRRWSGYITWLPGFPIRRCLRARPTYVFSGALLAATLLLSAGLANAQSRYSLYPIRPFFSPSGMNDLGQLVGTTFNDQPQGAVWTFGADPAFSMVGAPYDVVSDINDSGQMAGTRRLSATITHAAVFSPDGAVRDLGTLGGRTSSAQAINSRGEVAGTAATISGVQHAFLYADGTMRDLGALKGGWSYGYDINDAGQVVGGATMAPAHDAPTHPFLYTEGSMIDLSRFAAEFGIATSINNKGQVVGATHIGTFPDRAFLYESGVWTDLGTLGGVASYATSINDLGNIVGSSVLASGDASHGFLYTDGKMVDINTLLDLAEPGWTVHQAYLINASDQIAGFACRPHPDQGNAFDCASVLMSPIPEPAPVALWACAVTVGLAVQLRRRRVRE